MTKETRLPAIAAFLERARTKIGPLGGFVSADIFGSTPFNENDTDIGQRVEEHAPHGDYLSPMVYPSGYHRADPAVAARTSATTPSTAASSAWPRSARRSRGTDEAGGSGWLLWNPRNDYTGAALKDKVVAR